MQNKIMGYARVSTKEQNLDRQLIALSKYVPPENIVVDKMSGKSLDRPGYTALKGALGLRPGDTLYIKSLDRLSRRKIDIKKELQWFKDNGIRLMIIDLPTSMIRVPEGQDWIIEMIENIIIEVLASIAEQERETTLERQREGINAAKAKGKYLGRPRLVVPDNWDDVMIKWRAGEISTKEAMVQTGMKRNSFYKLSHRKE